MEASPDDAPPPLPEDLPPPLPPPYGDGSFELECSPLYDPTLDDDDVPPPLPDEPPPQHGMDSMQGSMAAGGYGDGSSGMNMNMMMGGGGGVSGGYGGGYGMHHQVSGGMGAGMGAGMAAGMGMGMDWQQQQMGTGMGFNGGIGMGGPRCPQLAGPYVQVTYGGGAPPVPPGGAPCQAVQPLWQYPHPAITGQQQALPPGAYQQPPPAMPFEFRGVQGGPPPPLPPAYGMLPQAGAPPLPLHIFPPPGAPWQPPGPSTVLPAGRWW